ncbi:MAG: AbrB/MazE/SpoVT family DNA-binding domain-containing protein [Myxococcales bacterium]|nr:AbrB/MazE/SpoVT family DNA-binding domain-containing protein [Myxococcales bacterium]
MKLATSKITAQGQISVPSEVRRRLGLAPGSSMDWEVEGDSIVVRRAGRYSSDAIHRALFPTPPTARSLNEMKEGIRQHMRKRHARD